MVVEAVHVTDVDLDMTITEEAPILSLDATHYVDSAECSSDEIRLVFDKPPRGFDEVLHQHPFVVGGPEWACERGRNGLPTAFYRQVLEIREIGPDSVVLKTRNAAFSELFTGRIIIEQRPSKKRSRFHDLSSNSGQPTYVQSANRKLFQVADFDNFTNTSLGNSTLQSRRAWWDNIVDTVTDTVTGTVDAAQDLISNTFNGVKDGITYVSGQVFNGVKNGLQYVNGRVAEGFENGLLYEAGKLVDGVKNSVQYFGGLVAEGLHDGIFYHAGRLAEGVVDGVMYASGKLFEGVKNGVTYVAGAVAQGVVDGLYYIDGILQGEVRISPQFDVINVNYDSDKDAAQESYPLSQFAKFQPANQIQESLTKMLTCSDCYFTLSGGFRFEMDVSRGAQIDRMLFTVFGDSKIKMEVTLTSEVSFELEHPLMPDIPIPINPTTLFGISLGIGLSLSLNARFEATVDFIGFETKPFAMASGSMEIGFLYEHNKGVHEIADFDFEHSHSDRADLLEAFTFLENGVMPKASLKASVVPAIQLDAFGMIDLSMNLVPYVQYEASRDLTSPCVFGMNYTTKHGMDFEVKLSDLHVPEVIPFIGGQQIYDTSRDIATTVIQDPACRAVECDGCVFGLAKNAAKGPGLPASGSDQNDDSEKNANPDTENDADSKGDTDTKVDETDRGTGASIDETVGDTDTKLDETDRDTDTKIDETDRDSDTKIDETDRDTGTKLDETDRDTDTEIDETGKAAADEDADANVDASAGSDTKVDEVDGDLDVVAHNNSTADDAEAASETDSNNADDDDDDNNNDDDGDAADEAANNNNNNNGTASSEGDRDAGPAAPDGVGDPPQKTSSDGEDTECVVGSDGVACSGHGECSLGQCTCKPGWEGALCSRSLESLDQTLQSVAEMAKSTIAFADEQRQRCAATEILCPEEEPVPENKRGTCVRSKADCLDSVASSDYDVFKENCLADSTKQVCGLRCVPLTAGSCGSTAPPLAKCAVGTVRCSDGSCASSATSCSTSTSCPSGEVPCGDGLSCAASLLACARKVKYDGCPVGKLECSARAGVCVDDLAECEGRTGCPEGDRLCGFSRGEEGKVVVDDGKPVPICRSKCPTLDKPVFVERSIVPSDSETTTIDVASSSGDAPVLSINIAPGGLSAALEPDAAVVLSALPVADSDLASGAFSAYHDSGMIVSSVVTVKPSRLVVVDGLSFDMPIVDVFAESSETACQAVLSNLAAISSDDIESATASRVSSCRKGTASRCSCLFDVPHFTTFAVVDEEASSKTMESDGLAEGSDTASPSSSSPSPSDASSPSSTNGNAQTSSPSSSNGKTSSPSSSNGKTSSPSSSNGSSKTPPPSVPSDDNNFAGDTTAAPIRGGATFLDSTGHNSAGGSSSSSSVGVDNEVSLSAATTLCPMSLLWVLSLVIGLYQ